MSDRDLKKTYGLFDNPLNKKLISELRRGGEEILVFPRITAQKKDLTETAAAFLQNLNDFQWLILTDVLAADYFIESLGELEIDFFELDNLTVCALGEAVADRLRFVQVHADVIPPKLNDETIFSAIYSYAANELRDSRFLVVREDASRPLFIEKLKAENAVIRELPIYKAEFSDEPAVTKLKTLLRGGAVDEFIFSSPEDLLSLRFLIPGADLNSILSETRVSAISEIVFQTLQENGLRPLYFQAK